MKNIVIVAWIVSAAAAASWTWMRVQEAREATVQAGFVACAVACGHTAPAAMSLPGGMQ